MVVMFRRAALCLSFSAAFLATSVRAQQTTLLVDVDHRAQISLDGPWHFIPDPYREGWGSNPDRASSNGYAKNAHYVPGGPLVQYDFARSPTLNVPGDWNSQKDSLFYYEGLLWYQHDFTYRLKPHTHLFVHFGSVNYAAQIFINGRYACNHEGGYTPFDCEITSLVKDGDNFIVAAVDDQRTVDRVPTVRMDWWNYGGITRPVSLIELPETYIDDYSLQLKRGTPNSSDARLDGYVHLTGAEPGTHVALRIADLHIEKDAVTDTNGRAEFSFAAPGLELWSPEHPRLYEILLHAGDDNLKDDIGFRTIEVQGDQILLNGNPVFLRGISYHDEAPFRSGRSWSDKDAETLLGWAHELHCNFVRMAHYPHTENEIRLADKLGIMVWDEIPVYWGIDWTNPRTLAVEARGEDPTRLITSAIVTHFKGTTATLDDPLGQDLDVLGYNEYLGWYQGKPETIPDYTWQNPMGKPVIISEFGAGANAGLHGPATEMFTEEYQDYVFRQQFQMLAKMPFLRGMTPWVLMDFRSPMRQLPGIQDDYNRKGLVSDKGEKKKAFFTLQDYYSKMQK
jgi:beta-glucuronidase